MNKIEKFRHKSNAKQKLRDRENKLYQEVNFQDRPEWMHKRIKRQRLDPYEKEMMMHWIFTTEYENWRSTSPFQGEEETLWGLNVKAHRKKSDCLKSHFDCSYSYNPKAQDNVRHECKMHEFEIWRTRFKEPTAMEPVQTEMRKFYKFPPMFTDYQSLTDHINFFYQTKYGMFTCHTNRILYGRVRFPIELI